jgi:hypothetical protein
MVVVAGEAKFYCGLFGHVPCCTSESYITCISDSQSCRFNTWFRGRFWTDARTANRGRIEFELWTSPIHTRFSTRFSLPPVSNCCVIIINHTYVILYQVMPGRSRHARLALAQKISSENLSNSKRSASFDKSVFETTSAMSELVKAFANPVADMIPSLCPYSTQFSPSCPVALFQKMTVGLATHPGQVYLVPIGEQVGEGMTIPRGMESIGNVTTACVVFSGHHLLPLTSSAD